MLSPASLRVCCLAVMAPALTKAVKGQKDCLPFLLAKTYINNKTAVSLNELDQRNGISAPGTEGKALVPTNGNKRFNQNIRSVLTNGCNKRYYLEVIRRDKTDAVTSLESEKWHGTNLLTVPDKPGSNDTMNGNSSPLTDMGLAKANTSLNFHKQKRMSDASPFTPNPDNKQAVNTHTLLPSISSKSGNVSSPDLSNDVSKVPSSSENHCVENNIGTCLSISSDTPSIISALPVITSTLSVSLSNTLTKPDVSSSPTSESSVSCTAPCIASMVLPNDSLALRENLVILDVPNSASEASTSKTLYDANIDLPSTSKSNIEVPSSNPVEYELDIPILSTSGKPGFSQTNSLSPYDFSSLTLTGFKIITVDENREQNRPKKDFITAEEYTTLENRDLQLSSELEETRKLLHCVRMNDLNAHVKNQLQLFVKHYKQKLSIPCQRQVKDSPNKSSKESVDLKAELLQNENVRNLSTAALVSFVRELETGSAEKYLSQNKSQDTEQISPIFLTFSREDCVDIKHTSCKLMNIIRPALAAVDPELTECSSEEPDVATPRQKRARWKWAKERAAIAKRWSWLLMQKHEVVRRKNQLVQLEKEVRANKGNLCFEECVKPGSSAVSSHKASIRASQKQVSLKGFIKPVNGYVDHNSRKDPKPVIEVSSPSPAAPPPHNREALATSSHSCSRTRPLNTESFHKRKLVRTAELHLMNCKLAKLSTIGCHCNSQDKMNPCHLCGGRYNNVQSIDPESMPLQERIALLDSAYHPVLSFEEEVPHTLHLEHILKKKEAHYQSLLAAASPVEKKPRFGVKPKFVEIRNQSRKLKQFFAARYRNKHINHKTQRLQKRGLIFGKWKKLQKSSFYNRNRIRRPSIVSSVSSKDSPIPSPSSLIDDGSGFEQGKRRRDDLQFDIDDVILPCNTKLLRTENLKYKEIEIPSWRYMEADDDDNGGGDGDDDDDVCGGGGGDGEQEDISDAVFIERHHRLETEEKKIIRGISSSTLLGNVRRGRRHFRTDSRADSSDTNTPDPLMFYQQDIVFQDPSSIVTNDPFSPAISPPETPGSVTGVISDDSQTSMCNGMTPRTDKRKIVIPKRTEEAGRVSAEPDDVQPYERLQYPLTDQEYEDLLKQSTHLNEEPDAPAYIPVYPGSPAISSSSTSTVEEDDHMDPEWTVVKRETGPEQNLIMKLARR